MKIEIEMDMDKINKIFLEMKNLWLKDSQNFLKDKTLTKEELQLLSEMYSAFWRQKYLS